ncbi:hypothetical protein NBO_28g0068 [Nosema bombycis CQ1]|uniref:Uncharacterized protein n=1 Tax=Nosema bombycis (strain CQ1 / CVCC 102059) TaxID=578461 RepID=R0M910_NOSB1|nr:hypothetical protein NBO_28g0068 [Nosema bombycis CQ1]|eukprot:EOB14429.1 hypothetical protein NBO_28g0068 [Nosema bombycis CQ1]
MTEKAEKNKKVDVYKKVFFNKLNQPTMPITALSHERVFVSKIRYKTDKLNSNQI